MDYTLLQFPGRKIVAVIGGMHLLDSPDAQIAWTAGKLKDAGVQYFIGAHCTGINATYQIRQLNGLSKSDCLVGAVGYDLRPG